MTNDLLTVLFHNQPVGRLALTNDNCCAFEYFPEWIDHGFSISPLKLPLRKGLFIAKRDPFDGNFGIFNDSLPDGWGRLLLNRLLQNKGINEFYLTPIERLSIIGHNGMGALSYEPETPFTKNNPFIELQEIQQEIEKILSEQNSEQLEKLFLYGGSSGGARPKYLLEKDNKHWLVKFRNQSDPQNIGEIEYTYAITAKQCGIMMPEVRLWENQFFATERFDIQDGERIHVATASGLLDADFRQVSLDYIAIMQLTGYLTKSIKEVEQLFRRMIFNVLTNNRDDHAKNFSFLCFNGTWTLSPAYDLTPSYGFNGQHTTTINGKGIPDMADIIIAGKEAGITTKHCNIIYDEVLEGCRQLIKTYNP